MVKVLITPEIRPMRCIYEIADCKSYENINFQASK